MKSNLSVLIFKESSFCILFKRTLCVAQWFSTVSWAVGPGKVEMFLATPAGARHVLNIPQCTCSLTTRNDLAPEVNRLSWEPGFVGGLSTFSHWLRDPHSLPSVCGPSCLHPCGYEKNLRELLLGPHLCPFLLFKIKLRTFITRSFLWDILT